MYIKKTYPSRGTGKNVHIQPFTHPSPSPLLYPSSQWLHSQNELQRQGWHLKRDGDGTNLRGTSVLEWKAHEGDFGGG